MTRLTNVLKPVTVLTCAGLAFGLPVEMMFSMPWGAGRILVDLALAATAGWIFIRAGSERTGSERTFADAALGGTAFGGLMASWLLLLDAADVLWDLAQYEGWPLRLIGELVAFFVAGN